MRPPRTPLLARLGAGWLPALLAGALLRATLLVLLPAAPFTGLPAFEDALHQERAQAILAGEAADPELPDGSPCYPDWAAFLLALSGASIPAWFRIQTLVGLLTIPLAGWALSPWLDRRTRGIALLLYALHPLPALYALRWQPTVWSLALFWIVVRLGCGPLRPRLPGILAGGLALGAGFLLQPTLFALLAIAVLLNAAGPSRAPAAAGSGLAPLIPGTPHHPPATRRRLGRAGLWAATAAVLPLLLCAHHARLPGGAWAWNGSDAAVLARALGPEASPTARRAAPPIWTSYEELQAVANEAAGRELAPGERLAHWRRTAAQALLHHPGRAAALIARRALRLAAAPEVPDPVSLRYLLKTHAPALAWGLVLYAPWIGLALLGLAPLPGEGPRRRLGLLLVALVAVNLLGTASALSRLFLVCGLLPFAARGAVRLAPLVRGARRDGRARGLLTTALLVVLLLALDLPGAGRDENHAEDLRYAARAELEWRADRRRAQAYLSAARCADPANAWVWLDQAVLYEAEGLPEAAWGAYREALARGPQIPAALLGSARIAHAAGHLAAADSLLRRLLSTHPDHPAYLNEMAVVQLERGFSGKARRLLERALALSPGYRVAQANLRAVTAAEREAASRVLPEEVARRAPAELIAAGEAILAAWRAGDAEQAESLLAAALAAHPREPLTRYFEGVSALRAGEPRRAAGPLEALVRAYPGRAVTTELAARALRAAGRADEACALIAWSLARAADATNRRRLAALRLPFGCVADSSPTPPPDHPPR